MKRLLACMCLVLGNPGVARANEASDSEERLRVLDIQQAFLTRQLNFLDQLSNTYGRFLVIRDRLFLDPKDGLLAKVSRLFDAEPPEVCMDEEACISIYGWLKDWERLLLQLQEPGAGTLPAEHIASIVESTAFRDGLAKQSQKLEEILEEYRAAYDLAIQGQSEVVLLALLTTEEFEQRAASPHVAGVNILKNYGEHVNTFNTYVTDLNSLFDGARQALTTNMGDQLTLISHQLYQRLQLYAAYNRLMFPELEEQISRFENILLTDEILARVVPETLKLVKQGHRYNSQANYLQAEEVLRQLGEHIENAYDAESLQARHPLVSIDADRVRQATLLAKAHYDNLNRYINGSIAAQGGRWEALRTYILRRAQLPALRCSVNRRGETAPSRHKYDCNLFRKNVGPFIGLLKARAATDSLGEEQLAVISKSLNAVYLGPLHKGEEQ